MIARLYANENFPLPMVIALRELGHDVLITRDAGKANDAIPDEEVLPFAVENGRAVITHNRQDFMRLHGQSRTTKASLSARTTPISPRSQPKSTPGFRRWNLSKASCCGSIAEGNSSRHPAWLAVEDAEVFAEALVR